MKETRLDQQGPCRQMKGTEIHPVGQKEATGKALGYRKYIPKNSYIYI